MHGVAQVGHDHRPRFPRPSAGPRRRRGAQIRVGAGFMILAAALCLASLPIPGYLRPGGWTVTFVGIMVGELVLAVVVWFAPEAPTAIVLPIVLLNDLAAVLAVACLTDRSSARLVAVLLVLPTLYLGMFLSRRMLAVQAVMVAAATVTIMALAGERPIVLTIHTVIVEVAAISPAWAVLALREGLARTLAAKHRLSLVDPLTGLANRRGLTEHASDVVRAARVAGLPVAVLVADLDHFKRVNDTWGHRVGDEVLLVLARTVRECVGADDLVVRLGGEEVAVTGVLTPGAAAVTAERIRCRVGEQLAPWRTTVSVGVAWADPVGSDPESLVWDLVDRADERLYAAKEAGRDQVALPA